MQLGDITNLVRNNHLINNTCKKNKSEENRILYCLQSWEYIKFDCDVEDDVL